MRAGRANGDTFAAALDVAAPLGNEQGHRGGVTSAEKQPATHLAAAQLESAAVAPPVQRPLIPVPRPRMARQRVKSKSL